ncbi:surface protease GP63 [Trypanosoma rangeli SC58]|nr:surface protease GP63 [Trypanosoma rangeli SC58]
MLLLMSKRKQHGQLLQAMCQPRRSTPFLPLAVFLLLLVCCAAGCLADAPARRHRCGFGEMTRRGPPATAVVRDVPRRGQGTMQAYTVAAQGEESEWAPIRIKVSAKDMDDPSKHCTTVGEVHTLPDGNNVTCKESHLLTEARKDIVLKQLIPAAIKLHAERLSVKPVRGPIRMPYDGLGVCSSFTIPPWHHTIGVSGADLILYVNAIASGFAPAWSDVCVTLEDGRPYAGVLNIDPDEMTATNRFFAYAAHEIGHILGFWHSGFSRFNMLSKVPNIRGKKNVWVVSSPKVKALARQYYNCPTLEGMELEDEGAEGVKWHHWKGRNAKEELMSDMDPYMYYSAFTLAAFEDMGVYRANHSMADPLRWGKNSGCGLLENKCLTNGTTDYPAMFCNQDVNDIRMFCTHDRLSMGSCARYTLSQPVAPEYQYFDDPLVGCDYGFMDYCPYVEAALTECLNVDVDSTFPGNLIGSSSRCVKGEGLRFDNREIGDVCVNTQCSEGKLKVQFLGDDTWHDCNEGETVAPSGDKWGGGTITCPKYTDVCTVFHSFLTRPLLVVAPPLAEEPNHAGTVDTSAAAVGLSSLALLAVTAAAVAMAPL